MTEATGRIFAGVDGGGTKTRVLLANDEGRVIGAAQGGSTNANTLPAEQVRENLRAALDEAARAASLPSREIERIVLGMAGVNNEADQRTFDQLLDGVRGWKLLARRVANDTVTALIGGLGGREGIVLIAGTGSNCLGRRADGRTWQAGGLEYLIDDGGSGFDLARRAIVAATRAADRRGPPTSLQPRIFEALRVPGVAEVPRRLHFEGPEGPGKPMTKGQIAALAPIVFEEAARDAVASGIIEQGAAELRLMIETVVRELAFPGETPVSVVGSVIQNPTMRGAVERGLRQHAVPVHLQLPELPPAAGALLLAFEEAGLPPEPSRLAALRASLPTLAQS